MLSYFFESIITIGCKKYILNVAKNVNFTPRGARTLNLKMSRACKSNCRRSLARYHCAIGAMVCSSGTREVYMDDYGFTSGRL